MLVRPHGSARLELLGSTKKRRLYTVRVILLVVRQGREFSTWTRGIKYARALPHFRGYKNGGLPPDNYVFFI
jgi:hypothetical protein